jgi:hypothetical protein
MQLNLLLCESGSPAESDFPLKRGFQQKKRTPTSGRGSSLSIGIRWGRGVEYFFKTPFEAPRLY